MRGGSQCGYCTPGFICSMAAEYDRPGRCAPTSAASPSAEADPSHNGHESAGSALGAVDHEDADPSTDPTASTSRAVGKPVPLQRATGRFATRPTPGSTPVSPPSIGDIPHFRRNNRPLCAGRIGLSPLTTMVLPLHDDNPTTTSPYVTVGIMIACTAGVRVPAPAAVARSRASADLRAGRRSRRC